MLKRDPRDYLPDVRDGLTHRERIVLQCLYDLQQERGGEECALGELVLLPRSHVNTFLHRFVQQTVKGLRVFQHHKMPEAS